MFLVISPICAGPLLSHHNSLLLSNHVLCHKLIALNIVSDYRRDAKASYLNIYLECSLDDIRFHNTREPIMKRLHKSAFPSVGIEGEVPS